jgi:sugar phosphate isomerase/epimerase
MRLGLDAGQLTLDLAVELGISGVPIGTDQLAGQGVENALAPLRERGLRVCQIGAFGYNPLSPDREFQAAQSDALKKAIPLAAQTGCPYITIGPGNYNPAGWGFASTDPRNQSEAALDDLAAALEPMLKRATEHRVNLTFEPYLKGVINSPARFLALWKRLQSPSLRANIDPSSLYVYEDLLDPRGKVEQTCKGFAGHYGLVHLKEIALGEGVHLHAGLVPLGKGATDWAQMLGLIAPHLPEDSWVILEHVEARDEGPASVRLLRDAAAKAGVVLK